MTIAFGPYVGEFGWEVRAWAPHVYARVTRMRVAGDQTPVIIVAKETSRALYEPALALPGVTFEPDWDWPKEPAEYMHLHRPEAQAAWEDRVADRIGVRRVGLHKPKPGLAFAEECLADIKKHRYEGFQGEPGRGVGFCLRKRFDLAPDRNYESWRDIPPLLSGHARRMIVVDRESADTAICEMRSCEVVAGESSGGMHLAATAGVPFVVWGEPKNRSRYEHDNWHGVPHRFIDGLQPEPQVIADAVADLLREVRGGV